MECWSNGVLERSAIRSRRITPRTRVLQMTRRPFLDCLHAQFFLAFQTVPFRLKNFHSTWAPVAKPAVFRSR
jgi:hypothetical protein